MNIVNVTQATEQLVIFSQHIAVFVLQSTIICGAGLLLAAVLTKRGPFVRSFVYRATLVMVVLVGVVRLVGVHMPIAVIHMPSAEPFRPATYWRATQPTHKSNSFMLPGPVVTLASSADDANNVSKVSTPFMVSRPIELRISPWQIFWIISLIVWVSGALRILISTILANVQLIRIRSTAKSIGTVPGKLIERNISVVESKLVSSPFLAGILRPTVFVPEGMESELTEHEFELVLRHETIHLDRQDCAWRLVSRLVGCVCWPNYLLWTLNAAIESTDEECVDALVIANEVSPKSYAECLLRVVETWLPARQETMIGSTVVSSAAEVHKRIAGILTFKGLPKELKSATKFGFCIVIACTGLAAYALVASGPDNGTPWNASKSYLEHFAVSADDFPRPARELPLLGLNNSLSFADRLRVYFDGMPSSFTQHSWESSGAPNNLYATSDELLKAHSRDFYAECLLSEQLAIIKNGRLSDFWMIRALKDAPAVIAGRAETVDGQPMAREPLVVGLAYLPKDGTQPHSAAEAVRYDYKYFIATDSEGRFFIPVEKYALVFNLVYPDSSEKGMKFALTSANVHPVLPQSGINVVQPIVAYPRIEWVTGAPDSGLSPEHPIVLPVKTAVVSWRPVAHADHYFVRISFAKTGMDVLFVPDFTQVPYSQLPRYLDDYSSIYRSKSPGRYRILYKATVTAIDDNWWFTESRPLYFRLRK